MRGGRCCNHPKDLSIITAPQSDVSIRCKLDDTANEEFQGISWQLDENACDDGDDSESHEQTEDDLQFDVGVSMNAKPKNHR